MERSITRYFSIMMQQSEPVYTELEGWKEDISGIRDYE